jgi:hypothetical protein
MKITRFGSSLNSPLAIEILYFVTGACVGLALAITVHNAKLDPATDNKFLACYTNICFS